jgi:pimeloyl-ACP methyl ester carboxylesterase
MGRFGRIALAALVVAIVGYAAIVGYFYVRQRDFQYDRGGRMYQLSETTLTNAEVVSIPSTDGAQLAGWYAPPEPGKPVILYYRGKSLSFSREYERYEVFANAGYGFLAFDYRGFGGTPGEVTQQHVLDDALAAFDWVQAKGFPVVIWGRSLGSGPATYVTAKRDARALLLESPFLSAAAVAQGAYWFLPIGWIMLDQYPLDQWIGGVGEPVFVAHGSLDPVIPVTQGEAVSRLAPQLAGLWVDAEGDHDNLWQHGIWSRAEAFFRTGVPGR